MANKQNFQNISAWENLLKIMPASYLSALIKEENWLVHSVDKNSSVLEIGCGDGRSLKQLLKRTPNLTGIDHDNTAISHAKENLSLAKKVKLYVRNANNLKFANNTFDCVICMTTFANFGKEKYKILAEMKRVCKKDGQILISVYSEKAFKARMQIYKKLKVPIKKIIGTTVVFESTRGMSDNTSEQFSHDELKKIFKKAKLKVIEIKNIGILNVCKLEK